MALYYDRNGEPMEMLDWAKRFEDVDYKRVAFDQVDDLDVSTVWLGLDHNFGAGSPLIFESMVFGTEPDEDNEMRRYATEEEARAGHAEIVEQLAAASDKQTA